MKTTACVLAALAVNLSALASVYAQAENGYVGRNGIFVVARNQNGVYEGAALLRLPDASTSNTRRLVFATLTEEARTSVRANGWPRAHQGVVFKTSLDPQKYSQQIFFAPEDPASAGEPQPWIYPAAYKQNGQWWTLHLFAKTPIDLSSSDGVRNLLGGASKSYSSEQGDGNYGAEQSESNPK